MYQRILVPVDGSATSSRGLQEAIGLAKLTGARLRLLHVIDVLSLALGGEGYAGSAGNLLVQVRRAGEEILQRAKALAEAEGVPVDTVSYENVSGRVSELVNDEVAKWNANLVVLGTHGRRGVSRLVLGSDAEQIVRSATVPVLLVRARAEEGEGKA